ncbi:MAG: hypothetical protein VX589_10510 [Myxococcota bacterium]|nr:hypothetical protein [Myxococcota bacterium]
MDHEYNGKFFALTIRQPWAWAICQAGRRIENRDWRPPPFAAYQPIALHASRAWGRNEKIEASALSCRLHPKIEVPLGADGYRLGAVVAVARLVGFIDLDVRADRGPYSFEIQTSKGYAVVGGTIPKDIVERAVQNQWWRGPCGWLLDAVQVLSEPIPVKGRPKLWTLPADVALKVASQVTVA